MVSSCHWLSYNQSETSTELVAINWSCDLLVSLEQEKRSGEEIKCWPQGKSSRLLQEHDSINLPGHSRSTS
ncbi:hypothetical protein AOLI_G00060790 [Acnodon oligacanthus]